MGSVRGDPIAYLKSRNTIAYSNYSADIAIAKWQRLVKLATNRIESSYQAVSTDLAKHLLHFVWLLASLVNPVCLAKLD